MIAKHKNTIKLLSLLLTICCSSSYAIIIPPYNPYNPVINNNQPPSIEEQIQQLQMEQQQLQMQQQEINLQLSQVNQQIISLQSYLAAQNSLGIKWVDAANGNFPSNAFTVYTNNNHAFHICHADFISGTHPGVIINSGCLITYGGSSLIEPTYQVLTGKMNTQWLTVVNPEIDNPTIYGEPDTVSGVASHAMIYNRTNLNLPSTYSTNKNLIPIQGGFEKGSPLYICRVQYNNNSYIGKTVDDNCDFAVGPAEIYVKNFQVLVAEVNK